ERRPRGPPRSLPPQDLSPRREARGAAHDARPAAEADAARHAAPQGVLRGGRDRVPVLRHGRPHRLAVRHHRLLHPRLDVQRQGARAPGRHHAQLPDDGRPDGADDRGRPRLHGGHRAHPEERPSRPAHRARERAAEDDQRGPARLHAPRRAEAPGDAHRRRRDPLLRGPHHPVRRARHEPRRAAAQLRGRHALPPPEQCREARRAGRDQDADPALHLHFPEGLHHDARAADDEPHTGRPRILMDARFIVAGFLVAAGALVPARAQDSTKPKDTEGLFLDMSKVNLGTISSEDDKKKYIYTIQLEKARMTRKTLKIVYENAFDLYRRGQFDEANELTRKILAIDPGYEDASILNRATMDLKGSVAPRVS